MSKKQLFALFTCNLVAWIVVQGMIGLLAVYAVRLGADPSWAGNILALSFVGLLIGTLVTGWLSGRFQQRKAMLAVAAAVNIPATFLMGQASDHVQLALLTAIVFLFVGMNFTTINILAGLFAGEAERGKVFGVLAMNNPLGALIGGALSGPIADRFGFPALFTVGAVCWVALPLLVMLISDKRAAPSPTEAATPSTGLGTPFYLFLVGTIAALAATFFAVLGRPLVMDGLKFDSTAISVTGAIGGAVSLPFAVLLGWLSDRIGRFWLIVACYVVGGLGLVALAVSTELWHFRLATILLASIGVSFGVLNAHIVDLVPPAQMSRVLTIFGFVGPLGGIIGFAITGNLIKNFGAPQTFIAGAVVTVAAIILIVAARPVRKHVTFDAASV